MNIGYARTSTLEQIAGFEAQVRDLEELGCEKIFKEQVSSVGRREQLQACIEFCRDGDVFIVTKLDRLARSTQHLLEIVEKLTAKGVALKIVNLGIDTTTATGKLMLTMLGAIAEFERAMMLERQREGIAKAKSEGKYKGRAATARAKLSDIIALTKEGLGASEIARRLNVSRASVYRLNGGSR
jgi:DNA invertase Pin-like site-specific DNA recombinase